MIFENDFPTRWSTLVSGFPSYTHLTSQVVVDGGVGGLVLL